MASILLSAARTHVDVWPKMEGLFLKGVRNALFPAQYKKGDSREVSPGGTVRIRKAIEAVRSQPSNAQAVMAEGEAAKLCAEAERSRSRS